MANTEMILYAGYGANREPEMLEHIIGRVPNVLGKVAILDVELCVQKLSQVTQDVAETAPVPKSPHAILVEAWGDDAAFETYASRKKNGSIVDANLFEITPEERALIAEWEMIEFGWY